MLVIATVVMLIVNLSINYYFYLSNNYTGVFYVDLSMLFVIGIAMKPLFSDKVMQWCFSYITMLNIHAAVVFLSFYFRNIFDDPMYGIIYLRVILYALVIFVLRKWVSKLYRKVLDYWHIYMLPIASLFFCYLVFFFDGDIKDTLTNNYFPLFSLTLLGLSIYVAIIHSLRTMTRQYAMREENLVIQTEREYLQLAADGMSERIKLMEEVSAQNSRTAHDQRHFNNVLLELLEHGQTDDAVSLLKNQNKTVPEISRFYCENHAVNAAVSHYVNIAEQAGIDVKISLDIPVDLAVDSLELSMVVSNLLENAVQSCLKMFATEAPFIRFTCKNAGRLLFEMENSCSKDASLDENGLPFSFDEDHGIGTKSVVAFANKYDGELLYKIEKSVFRVRLLV